MNFLRKKLLRIMIRVKLVLIVMLLGVSGTYARVWSQTDRMTVITENINLVEFFGLLQQKTELRFVFNHEDVQQYSVNVEAADKTLAEVLEIALRDKPLEYEITSKHVIISLADKRQVVQQAPQRITVTGTVTGSNGMPLIGVTVTVKDTYIGTATDAAGKFSLTFNPAEGGTLVVSMIGMEKQEIPIGDRREFAIKMKEEASQMDEVVVTGYYTASKESYTGASRTINGEELKAAGNQNILSSLKNLDPSFMMVENNAAGSNPNVMPEFQIRGQSSLSGLRDDYTSNPNMPLFVLDGFEVSAEKIFDMDIYRVNSITILKDAAATAIYGSRAANGVVVIETVSPTPSRLYVTYNADLTFAAADLTGYDVLNAREKLEFETMAGIYSSYDSGNAYYKTMMDDVYNQRLRNVESGYDTYWLSKPIHSLSVSHKHTLRVDGGSDSFRYALNANYNDQKGVMKRSGRVRQGIGMEFQYLYNNFNFSNEMTYNSIVGKNSPYGNFSTYAGLNPYYRYMDDNGNYIPILDDDSWAVSTAWKQVQYNPLYNTTLNTRDQNNYDEFQNKFNVIWNVLPGWVVRGNISIYKQNSGTVVFKPAKHTDFASWTGEDYDRRGMYQSRNGVQKTLEAKVMTSYQQSFGKHMMTVNGLWEIRDINNRWEQVIAEGFPNDNLDDLGSALQYQKEGVPTSGDEQRRLVGFFLSGNYIYDDRYMLDITGRMDASSEFGSDKRWAPFWSVGIGWNLHKERFMEDVDFINRLKLRATYGLTGSVNYDPYQALTTYEYLTGTRYHFGQGAALMALGNSALGWQKTHEQNYGVDFDMWDNRIQITANYYIKLSKDVVTALTLPPSTGFGTYVDNLGEIENRGFEVNLRVNPVKDVANGISLSFFGTVAHNKNILKKLSNSLKAYNESQDEHMDNIGTSTEGDMGRRNRPRVRFIEGASINSIWVNPSLGIDAASGSEIFRASDGTTTNKWSSRNYVIGGCTDPKVMGTFGVNFTYKRLRLNANFYYSAGGDLYNQTLIDRVQDADFRYNVDRRVLTDRWWAPGDISKYTANTGYNNNTNAGARTKPTSRFIERNNYLELSSVNASYELNPDWVRRIGLSQLRITFYMNDVFRASTVRIERGTNYPFARNFSLGIQARF